MRSIDVRWLLLLGLAACTYEDEYHEQDWESDASCLVHDTRGTRCHDYKLEDPAERNGLRATCEGRFDEDSDCSSSNRIGTCEFENGFPLRATHIYRGFTAVDEFIVQCGSSGGEFKD